MTTASKKNEFRLATLLRLRETTRDECRSSLAEAHRADERLLDQLARLGMEQRQSQDECRKASRPGAIEVDRLVEAHRYVSSLRAREEELRRQRQTLAAEIDRRRQSVVKADQDVQILEKLQERRLLRQRMEEARQEAKQLDEAALQAAAF